MLLRGWVESSWGGRQVGCTEVVESRWEGRVGLGRDERWLCHDLWASWGEMRVGDGEKRIGYREAVESGDVVEAR